MWTYDEPCIRVDTRANNTNKPMLIGLCTAFIYESINRPQQLHQTQRYCVLFCCQRGSRLFGLALSQEGARYKARSPRAAIRSPSFALRPPTADQVRVASFARSSCDLARCAACIWCVTVCVCGWLVGVHFSGKSSDRALPRGLAVASRW